MRHSWLKIHRLGYFALIICVISEVMLSYFRVGPLPVRVYILLLFLFIGSMAALLRLNQVKVPFPLKVLALMAMIAIVLQLPNLADPKFYYYLLRGLVASALIFMLTYSVLHKNLGKLDGLLGVFSWVVSASAFVALMQALGVGFFWDIRELAPVDMDNAVALSVSLHSRPVGLSYNSTELGYQISSVFPLTWYLMKKGKGHKKLLLQLFLVILFLGAVASQTRSAVLGIFVSCIVIASDMKKQKLNHVKLWFPLAGMALVIGAIVYGFGLSARLVEMDESAKGKIFLIYMGLLYMFNHPFGAGILMQDFFAFKQRAIGFFEAYGDSVVAQVEKYTPHNQFVNTGVMYGWAGLVILCIFYWRMWSKLNQVKRKGPGHFFVGVAMQASIAGYLVNSFFHNAGAFVLDPLAWYFIAIFEAVITEFPNVRFLTHKEIDAQEML